MIPITKPVFDGEEEAAVAEVLRSGWVSQGPKVAEFERAFAAHVGARQAVATTSCTTALHLALVALGIGPGDEVIVPAFTFVATANAVRFCGARPVFVDIDLATYNLAVAPIEAVLTPRTKGIIPVHLFGLAADIDPVLAVARRHGLRVIEDAACGFGARYRGKHTGTFGDAGCFSFHPRKAITTGEGGMVTTDDPALAERLRALRSHAATLSDLERHRGRGFVLPEFNEVGFNYRMTDVQAAIGLAQLRKADAILKARAERAARYDALLADCEALALPQTPPDFTHGYQSYVTRVRRGWDRDAIALALEAQGIATRQGTHAVPPLGAYRGPWRPEDFPRALEADRATLTLPLYPQMTDAEQDLVVQALHDALRRPTAPDSGPSRSSDI
jgi:dTDP-4-amino-4,6-dideoxygalactose transaminase